MLMKNGVGGHNMTGMGGMDDMDGMDGMGGMGGMHMMKMYFHFGTDSTILFSFWKTNNWQGMLASCFGIFFIAMFYEGLKLGREVLLKRYPSACDNWYSMFRGQHLLQSVLHVVQIVLSYFLMLIFMTFNMWLCIAVALGAGVGYFLFAWDRTAIADPNEHCH